MKFDEAGTYKIEYTATDGCGNSTTEDRLVTVEAPPRTVLYTDGTFIINELGEDRSANEALHGAARNEFIPFNPDGLTDIEKYIFTSTSDRPWTSINTSIRAVGIGSEILPTSTAYWFASLPNCKSVELSNLDTSVVTSMESMFDGFGGLTLDLSSFDTRSVTNMRKMFNACDKLVSVDLSSFDTSSVTDMYRMFRNCSHLTTIYASTDFDVTGVSSSGSMFQYLSSNLVGGAGTVWSSSNPQDKTYAHIDGGTSNPGYFTVKA